jgi:hypothetical protein
MQDRRTNFEEFPLTKALGDAPRAQQNATCSRSLTLEASSLWAIRSTPCNGHLPSPNGVEMARMAQASAGQRNRVVERTVAESPCLRRL